jgi:hypothetical protein
MGADTRLLLLLPLPLPLLLLLLWQAAAWLRRTSAAP